MGRKRAGGVCETGLGEGQNKDFYKFFKKGLTTDIHPARLPPRQDHTRHHATPPTPAHPCRVNTIHTITKSR